MSAVTLVLAYLLVVLGDTVRVTGSGMGCRSWPLCNGHIGLTGTLAAMLEQSHRYLAALVSIMVAVTLVTAWRTARHHHLVVTAASAAAGLIALQVALGALTVFAHNAGWTVAAHLAGAWLVVGAVTVTAVATWRPTPRLPARSGQGGVPPAPARPARAPAGRLAEAAVISLFALSVTGMLVLHEGASDACPTWPFCTAGGHPAGLVALQYTHRGVALIASLVVVAAAVVTWRSARSGRADRIVAMAATVLLAATAAAGAVVAVTGAPAAAQGVHLALASALWITVVALATPVAPGHHGSAARSDSPPGHSGQRPPRRVAPAAVTRP